MKNKTTRYDWGNYLSYVEKANIAFKEFNEGDQIKKQSKKNWNRFNMEMQKTIKEVREAGNK